MSQNTVELEHKTTKEVITQYLIIILLMNFLLVLLVTLGTVQQTHDYAKGFLSFFLDLLSQYIIIMAVSALSISIVLIIGVWTGKVLRKAREKVHRKVFEFMLEAQLSLLIMVASIVSTLVLSEAKFLLFNLLAIVIATIYIAQLEISNEETKREWILELLLIYILYGINIPLYYYFRATYEVVFNPYALTGTVRYMYETWWFFGLTLGVAVGIHILVNQIRYSQDFRPHKLDSGIDREATMI